MAKTKNRIKKMTFQKQNRTYTTPISDDDKYVKMTLAPCLANVRTIDLPMPLEPPVTNIVLLSNNFISNLEFFS